MTTDLRKALEDYLEVRRALGYKLKDEEGMLRRFIEHLESIGDTTVTAEVAHAWATIKAGSKPTQWAKRLAPVRMFATYLKTIDPATEIPPQLIGRVTRATPYLYSDADIAALLKAVESFSTPLRVATYRTLIGLLAATGMRVGEAIGADRDDLDLKPEVLVVKQGKFGKTRALPLHASTVTALADYLEQRDRLYPQPSTAAMFISAVGKRLIYNNVHMNWFNFVHMRRATTALGDLPATDPRPAPHLRCRTMLDWYRDRRRRAARLPLLSTYLGHVHPETPTGICQRRRSCSSSPPSASSATSEAAHEHARPDPAGVLHRPADPPAARQPAHHRRLPRHDAAAARLRPTAARQTAIPARLRRPRPPTDQRVP